MGCGALLVASTSEPCDAMSDARWQRLMELLHQAMRLAPAQRTTFLDDECASEPDLRAELVSLLDENARTRSGFVESFSPAVAPDAQGAVGALSPGQIFCERFRLVSKLGEGGMGQVWLAEQFSPVRRRVALKLIRAGMYDEAVAQRFRAEQQSLAIMDHPAIAKVFDAGATPQGQPYFVMEYVPGPPITEYCDQNKLTIRQRLELFIQACDGVQHAHRKAFIHRDLKPANILVVEVDGRPQPRIIDFGLAKAIAAKAIAVKAIAARANDPLQYTRWGQFLGTPGYMSPEQVNRDAQDVDTRTDVYSLGVVLYVLLAGLQPFEIKPRQPPHVDELLRRLREEDPPKPSGKLSHDRDTLSATAAARCTGRTELVSLLRGDLDWIAMKALERDRDRRYGTPAELAADLRRYLNHEAVLARPPSRVYRARKYIRRHRVAVGVTAGLMVLLAAFSVLQGLELRRTAQQRDRATRITEFMTGMFKVADPSEARGNSVTVREILDKASKDIRTGLGQDPQVQAQMMQVMASTYMNLGLYPRAHDLAKAALEAQLALLGPENRETLASRELLAWSESRAGNPAAAESQERAVLADEQRVLGREDPLTLETMIHLATMLQRRNDYRGEEALAREVIQISTRPMAPESVLSLQARSLLAGSLFIQLRLSDAEQAFRQLLDADRRLLGPDHPDTLKAMSNLGIVINFQGRRAQAEPLFRDALSLEQRVFGPEHDVTLMTRAHLGYLLRSEGRGVEAEKLDRETWTIRARTLAPDDSRTMWSESSVARDLLLEGDLAAAERLERAAMAGLRRVAGAADTDTVDAQTGLAEILNREGRWAEAEPLARESLTQAPHSRNPLAMADAMHALGISLAHGNRYPEADKLFRELLEQHSDPDFRSSMWYSYACTAAAAQDTEGALRYLHEAISAGYRDLDKLSLDADLQGMRGNQKFRQLVADLKAPSTSVVRP
jgi:eukaryotic-like serine/threonine-protein kinase